MSGQTPGILIVDDERLIRASIGDVLGAEGYAFVSADSGRAALESAADTRIGVVLLDVAPGDQDGIEVLERLLALRPGLRIVMLSDVTEQDRVLDALRLGACDYLAKPIYDEELILTVRRAADGYETSSDLTRLRGRLDRLVARIDELAHAPSGPDVGARAVQIRDGLVQAASEMLEADKTSLMLLDADGASLSVVACVGRECKPEDLDPVAPGDGVAGVVLSRGEPLLVADVASDPRIRGADEDGRYATASFVVAPVGSGGRTFGVLSATDRASRGEFGADDLVLLRVLATHAGALLAPVDETTAVADAPEPGRAEGDVTVAFEPGAHGADVLGKDEGIDGLDRDAELARTICQASTDEVEPQRVIQGALRPVGTMLPAAPVSLFLIDPGDGELRKEGEYDGGWAGDRDQLPRNVGLTGSVLQTGHVVATADPSADPRFDADVDTPQDGQVRPYLCVPLRLRGKVVGVLRAFLEHGDAPSARTAEVLGAALSAAVRNALLYRSLVEAIEEVAEARRAARR